MRNVKPFFYFLAACMFFDCSPAAWAASDVRLKFQRTGTDDSQVKVMVVDENGASLKGATATVTSSHAFRTTKGSVTDKILCPNVNGNTSPTISLVFEIANLPEALDFQQVGMDLHALSGADSYQDPKDGRHRQFNVSVSTGLDAQNMKAWGTLSNIDIAANIGTAGQVHKYWMVKGEEKQQCGEKIRLELKFTKGEQNEGCFVGLSEIALTTKDEVTPAPEPQPEDDRLEAGIYNIVWKNNTSSYMAEEADGSMVVKDYDVTQRIFWELIPTDKENCFQIRNTATGKYVGSCNKTPSSASTISTTTGPVEYYLGETSATAGESAGCYYLSSTDCADYDKESAGPRALNKDGASSNIITWQAGTERKGSYWRLVKTEDLYELRPFMLSDEVGKPRYTYTMTSPKGMALEMDAAGQLGWKPKNESASQTWYFVGTGNRAGGYLLVNAKEHRVFHLAGEQETRWIVVDNAGGDGYQFRPYKSKDDAQTTLTVEGESVMKFRLTHTEFARRYQVYELPCGTLGDRYVVQARVEGDVVKPMVYPMAYANRSELIVPNAPRPATWYSFFTQDQATVAAGKKFEVRLRLNEAPLEGQEGFLYFDWNRDGLFETAYTVDLRQESVVEVTVPETVADGKTRMRFRLTENGLTDAEDEVIGQTFDWVVNTVKESPETHTLTVLVNDEHRGAVVQQQDGAQDGTCHLIATPKGNARFVCWREGRNVVALEEDYRFVLNHPTTLMACFSPNTDADITGVEEDAAVSSRLVQVTAANKQIRVSTASPLKKVMVFTATGLLLAQSDQAVIDLPEAADGTYIVKVYTATKDEAVKVLLK